MAYYLHVTGMQFNAPQQKSPSSATYTGMCPLKNNAGIGMDNEVRVASPPVSFGPCPCVGSHQSQQQQVCNNVYVAKDRERMNPGI